MAYHSISDKKALSLAALMAASLSLSTALPTQSHAKDFLDDVEISGYIEPELRIFTQSPSRPGQNANDFSIAGEVTFETFWDNSDQWIVVKPFARWDLRDHERSHWDLREAKYARVIGDWEFRIGIDKVFWGVTEAAHLIDIINQSDFVESVDGEEKLGQPLVQVSTAQDFGTFDFYLLPYFRERTYPAADGRPATDIPVDEASARFESSQEERHVDFAARYSNTFEDWDVGLSYFQGTARDPILQPGFNSKGEFVLIPYYAQIKQVSVDVQATKEAWLYKFEGFMRNELGANYFQASGGIEYSFYGIFDTSGDLGIIAEYIWDDRGENFANPFANDAFAGMRWALNDEASTTLLGGAILDLDTSALSLSLEAERRLGDDYFVSVEARFFTNVPQSDPLFSYTDDDFLQLRVARYF